MYDLPIRLIVFDADLTLWDHPDVSSLKIPFRRIEQDLIIDSCGTKFGLYRDIRALLQQLKKRKITVSLATWNKPENVEEALRRLEIDHFFDYVEAESHPDKHNLIRNILSRLSEDGVQLVPMEILYIDDRDIHLTDIRRAIGEIFFVQMWKDIEKPLDILALL